MKTTHPLLHQIQRLRPLPWALLSLLLAVCAAVALPWPTGTTGPAQPRAVVPDASRTAGLPPLQRTPTVSDVPVPAAAAAPALRLLGTTVSSEGSLAIVRRAGDPRLLPLRVGDQVDGMVVSAIQSGRVALAPAGLTVPPTVVLDAAPSATAAADAAAVPARPRPAPPQTQYTEPEVVVEGH